MLKNLGNRIREIRKEKGMTLVEIARRTGVAQATLSRIETGVMIGTLESHEKIAEVLGVGLADLYAGLDARLERIEHVGQKEEKKVTFQDRNVRWELLAPGGSKKKIMPLELSLQPGGSTERQQEERGVEKFIYLLEGDVTVRIEKNDYPLKAGETLYFDASLSHQFVNASSRTARVLVAVSPARI